MKKKKSKKSNLVLYFNLLDTPISSNEDFIFVNAMLFEYGYEKKCIEVVIPLDVNFYLDCLLYKNVFNTFTELYFSHGFIGNINKICNRGYIKNLYVDNGVINGVNIEKDFKLLKEINYV